MKQLIFLFSITFFFGCMESDNQKSGKEGQQLPEFNILLTDSVTSFNTRDIPTGKPIALFYLSPYCPYCKAQTKEIIEDMDKLKNIQFYFVTRHPIQALRTFSNEYQLSKYHNITTGIDTGHFVADYFETTGVPYMAIYGKNKKLNKTFLGKIYTTQLKKVAEE